jgi:hypothetical protein
VVRTVVHGTRITSAEVKIEDLDDRQRKLSGAVVELRADARYTTRALDKILDDRGLSRPAPTEGERR